MALLTETPDLNGVADVGLASLRSHRQIQVFSFRPRGPTSSTGMNMMQRYRSF